MLKNKITQEEFDKLPAVIQAEYSKSGDAFFLQAEESVTLGDSLKKERQTREEKERELARLQGELGNLKGVDLERYRKLVEQEESAAQRKAEEERDYEGAKKIAVEAAIKPLQEKLTALTAELEDERGFTAQTLIGEKLKGWSGQKVAPHLQEAFEALIRQKYDPKVKRNGKERLPIFSQDGLEVGFDAFLEKLPEQDWAKHFLLSDANGTGGGAEAGKVVTGQAAGGKKTVKYGDAAAMRQHADAIAKGEVIVTD